MEPIIKKRIEVFDDPKRRVGATYVPGEGTHVRVWAPERNQAEVQWLDRTTKLLQKNDDGYFYGVFPEAVPGDRYSFVIDGKVFPDPASRHQPLGIKGPSEVVALEYDWHDSAWQGVPYNEWVMYELHVGTFSAKGTFEGVIDDLPRLKDLGVNALEIMPVSCFPGTRNWGYDGVFAHGIQQSYGGPEEFKRMIDACHMQGFAVILDVVYNHVGPEGNILPDFGPYFQTKYRTPWGAALNFDGPKSEDVRNYFLQSAWQWFTEFHIDGLRLDAVHTIFDTSPIPFLEELSLVKRYAEKLRGHPIVLIAETEMNDSRLLAAPENNGLGMDAQWADDLHHILHVLITEETGSYYIDYNGGLEQLARTYENGVAFQGEYSFSRHRCHGRSYQGVNVNRMIVQTQNHDQIGNRIYGKRLNSLVEFDRIKLCAAAIFLSPCTPLFFMGEEIASEIPFHYFISHEEQDLIDMVRKGRSEEFNLTMQEIDPVSEELFRESTLFDKMPKEAELSSHAFALYKDLIALSKKVRKFKHRVDIDKDQKIVVLSYSDDAGEHVRCILSFNHDAVMYGSQNFENLEVTLSTSDYQETADKIAGRSFDGLIKIAPFSAMVLEKSAA